MTDHIAINEKRLLDVIAEMRIHGETSARTTEIIDKYMGGFSSNKKVPASDSWNAQFGKYLKAHQASLGIAEIASKQRVVVDGHPTTCSIWNLNV